MLPADGQINRLIARGMCVWGRGTWVTGATSLTCQKFVRVVKDIWHAEHVQDLHGIPERSMLKPKYEYLPLIPGIH